TEKFPLGVRLSNAIVSYVAYLGKMIWPEDLAVLYPHPGRWESWQIIGAAVVLLAISFVAIAAGFLYRARLSSSSSNPSSPNQSRAKDEGEAASDRRYLIFGWLWYLGTLVPVIGLVQAGAHAFADRYTYIPLIGV